MDGAIFPGISSPIRIIYGIFTTQRLPLAALMRIIESGLFVYLPLLIHIRKLHKLPHVGQFYGAGGAVPLFGDDDFGVAFF